MKKSTTILLAAAALLMAFGNLFSGWGETACYMTANASALGALIGAAAGKAKSRQG